MADIKTPKAMNSASSINNLDEEDFLLVKHNTLQHLKLDIFVAADSPVHDGLEALKGDIIPVRGAIASAKNVHELQIALHQMRHKVQQMENLAKKEKVHSVVEYLQTVAKKVGLYEDPASYYEKQRRFYEDKRQANYEAHLKALKQEEYIDKVEKEKQKPSMGLLEAVFKGIGIVKLLKLSKEFKNKLEEQSKANAELKKKGEALKAYTQAQWLKVGNFIDPFGNDYQLIKGQAVEVIKKFSLESIAIEPGKEMSPRDMSSFLTNTNTITSLIAQRVGLKDSAIGLNGHTSLWATSNSDVGALARLGNNGSSIIVLNDGVSGNDLVKAWTHSMVNYSMKPGLGLKVDVEALDGVGSDVKFNNGVSSIVKEAIKAVGNEDVNKLKRLEAQMETSLKQNFWSTTLGNSYFSLEPEDKAKLNSPEMISAVKDFAAGNGLKGLVTQLYENDLLLKPEFSGVLDKIDNPSAELKQTMSDISRGYEEIGQVKRSVNELAQGHTVQSIIGLMQGDKTMQVSPASVEMLGTHVERHLFPVTSAGQSINIVSYKMHTDARFEQQREALLSSVVGSENLITPVREFTQQELAKIVENKRGKTIVGDVTPLHDNVNPVPELNKNEQGEVKLAEKLSSLKDELHVGGNNLTRAMSFDVEPALSVGSVKEVLNSGIHRLTINENLIRSKREEMGNSNDLSNIKKVNVTW